ncbi:hypothetical protein CTI12_AA536920 [Artemisia annua]|uniref:Replication protein A 70 kDa DNA-binding subunit B/D first OB fold domain-containing protein n=1 Tax=Artemisia annua TaxID=35608 RepID=A0A2U1L218_ARTAN|nr:hypothetical protein CTI12_AA536920 [Artemisia annua]
MATDMSMEGSGSISGGAFSGTAGHYGCSNAVYNAASSGNISGAASGSSDSSVLPIAAPGTSMVNAVTYSPAQAITVDGLVSTFRVANAMSHSDASDQSGLSIQGSVAFPTPISNNGVSDNVPMVLDFLAGQVMGSSVPTPSSSTGRPALPQTAVPTRRRSRACHPHMQHANSEPVQGPIAPRQRQGMPLEYMRFGFCDKVCQHCGALFWLEEKRTGMPTSAAPQYQKAMALTSDVAAQSTAAIPVVPQRSLAYFTELNPADNSKFIEARVYRKWTAMKAPALIPTGFSCILIDKKGSAIQANSDLKDKERFERELQQNCVYRILGFGFEKTDGWRKTLDNDMTLCLGKHTETHLLKDDNYPHHYFNFAAYNELGPRLEKKNPILTDYIGYIHNVEKVKEYGGATGNKIKLRNIGIRNLNYSFRLIMTDGTGNATMTCFTPNTEGLIKDVNTLLEEVADKNPEIIPQQITALENTRHVFQFRFAKPIGKGPPTFVLQKVMDHIPTILPTPAEGPSSPPPASPTEQTST